MSSLTLAFLGFGIIVLIGFIIVLTDKGLKWKGKQQ
jgi:preprotein translocase subunit Sss1